MSPTVKNNKSKAFSNSIRTHPRVDEYWPTHTNASTCVWAVHDQLLFRARTYNARRAAIDNTLSKFGVTTKPLTTLFSGQLKELDQRLDVQVVQLTTRRAKPLAARAVFSLTRSLRTGVLKDLPRDVSPNHVLVPAWNGDACPYGPPREYRGGASLPPLPPPAQPHGPFKPTITLIDSGYIGSLYRSEHNWDPDPLSQLLGHAQPDPTQAWWPTSAGTATGTTPSSSWARCPLDVPDARYPAAPLRLDALAGHANFVAGLLAYRSYLPTLDIWNHNGSYVADMTLAHVTTEIAVLRSLLESQQQLHSQKMQMPQVIVVTFAFPPFESVLSSSWDSTMSQLRTYNANFVLVAPVGNQGTSQRRYPAAMATADPNPTYKTGKSSANISYPNVIGVGSLDPTGAKASTFTNKRASSDPWVTCSAIGEGVASSFLEVNLLPEDPSWPGIPTGGHDFGSYNSLALWQGTCFAAPKVAAAIANELTSPTDSALNAWQAAVTKHISAPPDPAVGLMFSDLG